VKHSRSWTSLVAFCVMTVSGAGLAFALILAGASVALANHHSSEVLQEEAPQPTSPPAAAPEPGAANLTTFSGMVTDSYCGARHLRHTNLTPTECAAACIRGGANFVLVDGDRRFLLTGAKASLGKLLGTRASVTGTLEGDTIMVSSAGPLS
jgi:hypothetical protein